MPKTTLQPRTVEWHTGAVTLTKKFKPTGDTIEIRQKGRLVTEVPVPAVPRLIEALLALKVANRDGSNYNSGVMRVAVVDGSGVETEVEDLTDTGRQVVRSAAERLIEEIEEHEAADK